MPSGCVAHVRRVTRLRFHRLEIAQAEAARSVVSHMPSAIAAEQS